jgi:hypothetical protein
LAASGHQPGAKAAAEGQQEGQEGQAGGAGAVGGAVGAAAGGGTRCCPLLPIAAHGARHGLQIITKGQGALEKQNKKRHTYLPIFLEFFLEIFIQVIFSPTWVPPLAPPPAVLTAPFWRVDCPEVGTAVPGERDSNSASNSVFCELFIESMHPPSSAGPTHRSISMTNALPAYFLVFRNSPCWFFTPLPLKSPKKKTGKKTPHSVAIWQIYAAFVFLQRPSLQQKSTRQLPFFYTLCTLEEELVTLGSSWATTRHPNMRVSPVQQRLPRRSCFTSEGSGK